MIETGGCFRLFSSSEKLKTLHYDLYPLRFCQQH